MTTNRGATASLIGNVLEWYDFAVYGYFAAVIGKAFFPADAPGSALLLSLAVFAIGFLARPFGGLIFAHIGDVAGRRRALILSTIVMAVPSTLIGLLPDYHTIGIAAPVALVLCRLLQGASVGGELPSSVTYLLEGAPPHRQALMASIPVCGAIGGILLGSAAAAAVSGSLSPAEVDEWGWRIPFLLGSVISIFAMFMRRTLPADAHVPAQAGPRAGLPIVRVLREHPTRVVLGFGTMVFVAVNFYLTYIYLATFMSDVTGLPRTLSLEINTISMIVLVVMALFGAWLADRLGAARVMAVSAGLWILLAYPLLRMVEHPDPGMALAGEIGLTLIFGPYNGVATYHLGRMFPQSVRMSGVSLVSNTCFAVLGGTTPMVATYAVGAWGPSSLAVYAIGAAVVSLASTIASDEQLRSAARRLRARLRDRTQAGALP